MCVAKVDAGSVVGDHVGADGDAVTVSVEHDGCAVALFDHVSGENGTVRVLDDDPFAEMIVDAVSGHANVETIDTVHSVLIFFKLVGRDDNVVTAQQVEANTFVVSHKAVADSGVFVAMVELNSVSAVLADGHSLQEYFLNLNGQNSVTTFFRCRLLANC